jgi:transcriptional regulator with GAF, ATPase, and Fis domain
MNPESYPKLVHLADGTETVLGGRIVTIGASPKCHVRMGDRSAPARAAHVMFLSGSYRIQALSDRTAIAINGMPADQSAELKHGDLLRINADEFRYLERECEGAPLVSGAAADPTDEIVGIVAALLKNHDGEISSGLVAAVARLLKCDAARLVGEGPADGSRKTIARYPEGASLERFSNRAIDWAKSASRTILMHDADWQDSLESKDSLQRNLVTSVLCAPLPDAKSVIGYLYLDKLRDNGSFTEQDRELCDRMLPLFSALLSNNREREEQRKTIALLQDANLQKGMIYESKPMCDTVTLAARFALTDSPILLLGETGTGKELMARFLHERSRRNGKPFKAINCGAIPANLIESELFGHEKGSFTGATQRNIGLFESARGGTVFLDEIGELPLMLQVKLLRALQEGEITRVGGTGIIAVDVRILAATNRDLEKEVREERFRQDLYFRLNVLTLTLPALRDRQQDVVLLADWFIKKYCRQFGLPEKTLSAAARNALLSHAWPGNIRELENCIQKAILCSSSNAITVDDVKSISRNSVLSSQPLSTPMTLKDARSRAEKEVIIRTLEKTKGNVALCSKILAIDRKWLMKLMTALGIEADEFRK